MKKAFLFLLVTLLFIQFTPAQTDDDVIKVETSLVLVPVTVTDQNGRFIPNLKREDFKLFEEGKPLPIAHFDTVDAPFTIVIMLDMSDSAKFNVIEIQQAAQAFVDQLRPEDAVVLFTFDKNVVLALDATANRRKIKYAILGTRTGGGTSLYSAVTEVTGNYLKDVPGRKAIVLFTDGIDTTSPMEDNFVSAVKSAQQSDAMIFPIQYDTVTGRTGSTPATENSKKLGMPGRTVVTAKGEFLNVAYKRGTQFMTMLAANSGGKFQFADSVADLAESFAKIAGQLKEQYTIGFYPPNQTTDGKQRDLKVQYVGDPKAKIKYRKGYVLRTGQNRER